MLSYFGGHVSVAKLRWREIDTALEDERLSKTERSSEIKEI